jgi:hypothetical protein
MRTLMRSGSGEGELHYVHLPFLSDSISMRIGVQTHAVAPHWLHYLSQVQTVLLFFVSGVLR